MEQAKIIDMLETYQESPSLMLWLEFILNTFLVVADACEGVNQNRRFVQVRTSSKH